MKAAEIRVLFCTIWLFTISYTLFGETEVHRRSAQKLELQDQADLEKVVLASFNRNHCLEVDTIVLPTQISLVSPITKAVVAYCTKQTLLSESLFLSAEKEAPTHESIAYLHALSVYRRDRRAALPYWEHLFLIATDKALKALSREYLDGRDPGDKIYAIEQKWNYYGTIQGGAGYQTNPLLNPSSRSSNQKSVLGNLTGTFGVQDQFSFGYLAANYSILYDFYASNHSANLLQQDLDFPVVLDTGENTQLRLRPFGTLTYLGDGPYYYATGLSLSGVSYRNGYKQRCLASIYTDHYPIRLLQHQGGQHYRFEYHWEFSALPWFWRLLVYIEHVQAGVDQTPSLKLVVPYSHNDIGIGSTIEHTFHWVSIGLTARLVFREDDQDSRYLSSDGRATTQSTRREDLKLSPEAYLIFPLARELQLIANYRWTRNLSNIGATDYQDLRYQDHRFLLSIKAAVSPL